MNRKDKVRLGLLSMISMISQPLLDLGTEFLEEGKTTSHSKDELNEHNGLKKFYYGENYVYAINQRNADKKAKKKGYI